MEHPPGRVTTDTPFFPVIEEAYRVFARSAPKTTGVCTKCCMTPADEARMLALAPRDIPFGLLHQWQDSVNYGIDARGFGWILPRILEVLASGQDDGYAGFHRPFRHFQGTGDPLHWTGAEWAVLDRFQRLYFRHHIARWGLSGMICMLTAEGWCFDDLDQQARTLPDDVLATAIWPAIGMPPQQGRFRIPAPGCIAEIRAQIRRFLSDPALQARMTDYALTEEDPDKAEIAAEVADGLRICADPD